MSDKMKVRQGKDGFSYPYTSPDLVIDQNGKSNTKKFEEIDSQFKDIANKTVFENGKLYLVKRDGTKLDSGTELPSNSETASTKITEEYMTENSFKLHWKGEIFKAPSDYVAWGGNTHYDKTLGKFIHWLYCAPAHLHSTSELYVIYIDKDTLISSEPIRCSF